MLIVYVTRVSVWAGVAALLLPLVVLAGEKPALPAPGSEPQVLTAPLPPPLTLARAVAMAESSNPGLAQATARARAMAETPAQAGALPEPSLSFGALNLPTDTFATGQEAMTQMQVGVSQAVPFPGKLALRVQAAEFRAAAAQFDAGEARLGLIRKVRSSWWNLFFLDQALSIVQHNQDLLREFVRIAETRYKTGQGMQSDVLLAQVELSKLLEGEIALQAARRNQATALNALLGRPADSAVVLPEQGDEALPVLPESALLHRLAADSRPLLAARRAAVDAAQTRVQLAEKEYYPDFKLGAAYGVRRGVNPNGSPRADMASLTVSINLPLFTGNRQDRALAQRKAEVQQEEYALQDQVAQVEAEIEQARADYRANRDQVSLYKTGIIPQARQTAASMLAAYQVDKVDFLNLIRAQVNLYNYETQYWKALSSAWQAWARLEAAVGAPLPQVAAGSVSGNEEMNHE